MRFVAILICLLLSVSLFANESICDAKCQLKQVEIYFNNIDKVFRKGSTEQDINSFLAHMHDEVKHEHPGYEADFNKSTWKQAFLRNLSKGWFTAGAESQTRILNVIHGKNHAAIEYSYGKLLPDGTWEKDKALFALLGFKAGQIVLLREYW